MAHPSISVAFATSPSSPDDIALAEDLGYERAWLFDTPQQSPDVWMVLALAAQRTESIGLGPGVLVPSLRHPMVNAAATRMLQGLAPGRVAVAFGTGFTGRAAMGLPPLTWSYMRRYITAYRGLLRGEVVEWDGARMRMLPAEQDPQTPPAPPPILISALGPKGAEVARAIGADGLFSFGAPSAAMDEFGWAALGTGGTVLDDGESPDSPRVREAAGPMWAITYHFPYTAAGADGVRDIPGGPEWLAVIEKTPETRPAPRCAHRPPRLAQRGGHRRVGGRWLRAGHQDEPDRPRRRYPPGGVGARRPGRDGDRLSPIRAGHPARARGLHRSHPTRGRLSWK